MEMGNTVHEFELAKSEFGHGIGPYRERARDYLPA
jgi:hypothetical protein